MQCDKRSVHKALPQKKKEMVVEKLLFLCLCKNSALNMAPSTFKTTTTKKYTHTTGMKRHRTRTCKPQSKASSMQREKRKVHRVLPQKQKQVMFEHILFPFVWKNSALNMAPSIFNIHNHTQTYPHTCDAMPATANMQTPTQTITHAMRKT